MRRPFLPTLWIALSSGVGALSVAYLWNRETSVDRRPVGDADGRRRMRFAPLAAVLCGFLVGCDVDVEPGGPVQLLTESSDSPQGGCFTNSAAGLLIVDPNYGTAILDEDAATVTRQQPRPVPVMWRPGFSGRQSGSQVQVLDPDGRVVAVTGNRYRIQGGYWAYVNAFLACGDVTPL
jgi:hypothetical protein